MNKNHTILWTKCSINCFITREQMKQNWNIQWHINIQDTYLYMHTDSTKTIKIKFVHANAINFLEWLPLRLARDSRLSQHHVRNVSKETIQFQIFPLKCFSLKRYIILNNSSTKGNSIFIQKQQDNIMMEAC